MIIEILMGNGLSTIKEIIINHYMIRFRDIIQVGVLQEKKLVKARLKMVTFMYIIRKMKLVIIRYQDLQ